MADDEHLQPARPDDAESKKPEYMPRFPWRWVLLGTTAVTILGGGYYLREQQKEAALREQIESVYNDRLGPAVQRYRAFREKVDRWVMDAAQNAPPEEYVDPRLDMAALHQGEGLYLRLEAEDAQTREGIAEAAKQMQADAITRCLGITPTSMRGFYEKGEFLMPAWIERAEEERAGTMRLRVIDDELARYADRDLPSILHMMQAQYLLLAVQHADNRRDAPVDVYLYDLRNDRKLLSTRTEAKGVLIPVRIAMGDAPRTGRRPQVHSGGANDCSIAAQIKELTGDTVPTFESELPEPETEGAETEGAEAEGAEAEEAETEGAETEGAETEEPESGPAEHDAPGDADDEGSPTGDEAAAEGA